MGTLFVVGIDILHQRISLQTRMNRVTGNSKKLNGFFQNRPLLLWLWVLMGLIERIEVDIKIIEWYSVIRIFFLIINK